MPRDALDGFGAKVLSAEAHVGATELDSRRLRDRGQKKILRLMDAIDDHDDVQNVFSNFDISDELIAAYEG